MRVLAEQENIIDRLRFSRPNNPLLQRARVGIGDQSEIENQEWLHPQK